MLPPLEFRLDPARGGQHVVLRQQLVELLLPAIINIRVMLIITVTFVSVILMIIFWNVSHLSWVAIKSCALKYCFSAP